MPAPRPLAWMGLAVLTAALAAGCAGPPWYMGQPLDGHPSIPDEHRDPPPSRLRRLAEEARGRGEGVLELRVLAGLERRSALRPAERQRLVQLLSARARTFARLGRPVAWAVDLRHLDELDPEGARARARSRAAAERRAGDFWLSVSENDQARAAYRWATAHGATGLERRLAAAEGRPPDPRLPASELALAVRDLPLRAVPPYVQSYLNAGGLDPATLRRGRRAAALVGRPALARRINEALGEPPHASDSTDDESAPTQARRDAGGSGGDGSTPAQARRNPGTGGEDGSTPARSRRDAGGSGEGGSTPSRARRNPATGSGEDGSTPSQARRNSRSGGDDGSTPPLAGGHPRASGDGRPTRPQAPALPPPAICRAGASRSVFLTGPTVADPLEVVYFACADRLRALRPADQLEIALLAYEEDSTSPEGLEAIAFLEALAGRRDAAARKLVDLVYFSEDRAAALSRVAGVWRRAGDTRRASEAERTRARYLGLLTTL